MSISRFPIVLIIGVLFLSACASTTPTPESMVDEPAAVMTEDLSDDMQESPTEVMDGSSHDPTPDEIMGDDKEGSETTPEPVDDAETSEIMLPDWFSATLVNVNTDERFTIGDYKGKVVLVETMAMW